MATEDFVERRAALEADMPRRIGALQAVMREKGIGAVLLCATAGPGLFGVAKYFSNLSMWYGRAFVVVGVDDPEPAIVHWSGFQSAWNRQEATTRRIETPDVAVALGALAAFERASEIAMEMAGDRRRIGVENLPHTWTAGEYEHFTERFPGVELVNLAREIDAIRAVKSPFELNEMTILGETMVQAFELFGKEARVGRRIWEVTADCEALIKAAGGAWGRVKMSLDQRPPTILPKVERTFRRDDLILLEIDYAGPFGLWYEMTALFSFDPLPEPVARKVAAYADVIDLMAGQLKPGLAVGQIPAICDGRFAELGLEVDGIHLPHAHSIGLDETDGPNSSASPDDVLANDMVLACHPGGIFLDGSGFAMSDSFRVTDAGGERMSRKDWLHRLMG